ncbi:MAG: ferric reductase-like transmembrane domain-containing protein [Chromatiales bacterium]|nr:ferric reductase-like transmembrane domain-containing protein [Chromatiales bacterium]
MRAILLWSGVYLALVLAPLVALLVGPAPRGAGLAWDFAMALGFAATSAMGLQFLLTARFRRASAPFGIDIIYYFHRYMAVVVLTAVGGHYLVIRVINPELLDGTKLTDAPGYLTAGRIATVCLVAIVVTSLWRKRLRIPYDAWRIAHTLLAVGAFVLAIVHIRAAGRHLNTPMQQVLWGLYSLGWLYLVIHIRVIKPWRMHTRPWRVAEVRTESLDSHTLVLEPVGHAGLRFRPGQFAWLTLDASPWRMREHPFSIASSAEHPERIEFTIKALGDFTRTIGPDALGKSACLDGPYGVFSVDRHPAASGFVFIAGGVGIAPIMSMLRTLAERGDTRPIRLVYCNRRADNVLFRDEIDALRTRLDLEVTHVIDEPHQAKDAVAGPVSETTLTAALAPETRAFEHFLCGPKAMSGQVQQALHRLGVPAGRVHFELFDMA